MNMPETLLSRLSDEDRTVLRTIGSYLSRMIQGQPVAELRTERRDELGLLASMASRAAQVITRARERDQAQKAELERRLKELEDAHTKQAKLLSTIRELSLPILRVHRDILLLPIIGELDATRADHILTTLLSEIRVTRARVVILDVTGVPTIDEAAAGALLRAANASSLLGAETLLCGVSPRVAQAAVSLEIDLHLMQPLRDLESALGAALRIAGQRIATV